SVSEPGIPARSERPMGTVVPEPEVKARLRELGVTVPRGVVGTGVLPDASALRAPLVLKAFGPDIVHKTELVAVKLGLTHDELTAAAVDMRNRLSPAGFLVEELCVAPDSVELIVGVTRRD